MRVLHPLEKQNPEQERKEENGYFVEGEGSRDPGSQCALCAVLSVCRKLRHRKQERKDFLAVLASGGQRDILGSLQNK